MVVYSIIGALLFIPPITIGIHELGHVFWVMVTGGRIVEINLFSNHGSVIFQGGADILVLSGAFSIGPSLAYLFFRLSKWRAGIMCVGLIWITCYSLIVYSANPSGSDLRYGPITIFVVIAQIGLVIGLDLLIRNVKRRIAARGNRQQS